MHARRHRVDVVHVVDEADVLLDLTVAGVVPVAHRLGPGQLAQKVAVVLVQRQLVEVLPVLDRQPHAAARRLAHEGGHRLLPRIDAGGAAAQHDPEARRVDPAEHVVQRRTQSVDILAVEGSDEGEIQFINQNAAHFIRLLLLEGIRRQVRGQSAHLFHHTASTGSWTRLLVAWSNLCASPNDCDFMNMRTLVLLRLERLESSVQE